jgi:NAD(P) transhydrogenase
MPCRPSVILPMASNGSRIAFLAVLKRPGAVRSSLSYTPSHLLCFVGYRYFSATSHLLNKDTSAKEVTSTPYSSLTIGIPRELFPNERRVALSPQSTSMLLKKGFSRVLVEKDAGKEAQFPDEQYVAAGATLVNRQELLGMTDIMLKVRPPLLDEEARHIKEGSTIFSFLYPAQNKAIVDTLASRRVNAFAVSLPNFALQKHSKLL